MNTSRKNTLWVALFAVSVMANMFFIGMMTGHGLHHGPMGMGPGGPPPSPIARMHEAARGLSQADQDVVARVFEKYDDRARGHMDALHQAFDHLRGVLTAPDYSAAKVKEAHHLVAQADTVTKDDIEAAMLDVAAQLSPQGRAQFFQNMLTPPWRKDFDHPPTDNGPPPVE